MTKWVVRIASAAAALYGLAVGVGVWVVEMRVLWVDDRLAVWEDDAELDGVVEMELDAEGVGDGDVKMMGSWRLFHTKTRESEKRLMW